MNLAAALEPTTSKGEILATEHFAILAATSAIPSFFVNISVSETLPQDAGVVRVYRLIQAE